MKRADLPEMQGKTLDAVEKFIKDYSFPPSIREVAHLTGVAKPTAQKHLQKLIDKGFLESFRPLGTVSFPRLRLVK